jgi:thioredoxin 1
VRKDRSAGQEYGIRVIPTQIFYDASGQELARHEGFMSREAILAQWRDLGISLDAVPGTGPLR